MVCVHTYSESDNTLLRYGRLKFSKMAAGRHLEFDPTGNGAVGSAVPENPTLEPNTTSIGWRVAEIWPFEVFPKCVNRPRGRWSVGRRSLVGRQYSYFLH